MEEEKKWKKEYSFKKQGGGGSEKNLIVGYTTYMYTTYTTLYS